MGKIIVSILVTLLFCYVTASDEAITLKFEQFKNDKPSELCNESIGIKVTVSNLGWGRSIVVYCGERGCTGRIIIV